MDVTLDERLEAMKLGVDPLDWARWKMQHVTLFGHAPITDYGARSYCTHPMHQSAARIINTANIALRHEHTHPKTMRTEDDPTIDGAMVASDPWDNIGFEEKVREFRDDE